MRQQGAHALALWLELSSLRLLTDRDRPVSSDSLLALGVLLLAVTHPTMGWMAQGPNRHGYCTQPLPSLQAES